MTVVQVIVLIFILGILICAAIAVYCMVRAIIEFLADSDTEDVYKSPTQRKWKSGRDRL